MFVIWQGGQIPFISNRKTWGNEEIWTITSDHIPVLVYDIDENGIGGQLTNMWVNSHPSVWMTVSTFWPSVGKTKTDTLKIEINSIKPFNNGETAGAITMALMSCLGVTNPYSLRDFIAINAINHSSATGKCINSRLCYIKPTSSSKYPKRHLITKHILEFI